MAGTHEKLTSVLDLPTIPEQASQPPSWRLLQHGQLVVAEQVIYERLQCPIDETIVQPGKEVERFNYARGIVAALPFDSYGSPSHSVHLDPPPNAKGDVTRVLLVGLFNYGYHPEGAHWPVVGLSEYIFFPVTH